MTDYNDGKWHPWNGDRKNPGVHDKSIVEAVWHDKNQGTAGISERLSGPDVLCMSLAWSNVIRFRVTKPYREPETYTGECFAYHYTNLAPSFAETPVNTSIPGKYTATHINGKLAKIVWEATQ